MTHKKYKFYNVSTIIIFALCVGSMIMASFAYKDAATTKEIREICSFGIMALLGITAFSFAIGFKPTNQRESINEYRKYVKVMLICMSIFMFVYITTYIQKIMCIDVLKEIAAWIVLFSIAITLLYNVMLVLIYVHYNFRDESEKIFSLNKNNCIVEKNSEKIYKLEDVNYNDVMIKLMSKDVWGSSINRKIISGQISVNVTSAIVKDLEEKIKVKCPTKDDKNMLSSIVDGCITNIANTYNPMHAIFATMIISLVVQLVTVSFGKAPQTIYTLIFPFIVVTSFVVHGYIRGQKAGEKYNIIRSVIQKLLNEECEA